MSLFLHTQTLILNSFDSIFSTWRYEHRWRKHNFWISTFVSQWWLLFCWGLLSIEITWRK